MYINSEFCINIVYLSRMIFLGFSKYIFLFSLYIVHFANLTNYVQSTPFGRMFMLII